MLRSIGWRGLTQAEQGREAAANLRVRMFAENIEAGKGGYHYAACPKSFAITKDDDGKEIHMERTEFWIPKSEKIGGVYGIDSPPEKAEEAVYINAPTVPSLRQHMACPREGHHDCVIIEGDEHFKVDGVPVAFEGHKTSCGATLIATVVGFGTA